MTNLPADPNDPVPEALVPIAASTWTYHFQQVCCAFACGMADLPADHD